MYAPANLLRLYAKWTW